MNAVAEEVIVPPLKLDLGCGPNAAPGFEGVDILPFDGKVKHVLNLVTLKEGVPEWKVLMRPTTDGYDLFKPWPWADSSVAEVNCSHFFEHLTRYERVFFWNELHRVMAPDAKLTLVTPCCFSERAYGDMTHEWPGVVGMHFAYLDPNWRKAQAPHDDHLFKCHFEFTWGFAMHQALHARNPEYQQHALTFWINAGQDMIATGYARKPKAES